MKLAILSLYRFVLRLLKPNAGLTRLSFNSATNYLFDGVPTPRMAKTDDGLKIEIDVNDYHGRILWLFGSNDWKVSRTVNALLSPGDTLLDIGANHGTIGFSARNRVGAEGEIHFFEPQPYLVRRLKAGMAQLAGRNIHLHEIALFDSAGTMELKLYEDHSGMASLVGAAENKSSIDTINIPVLETEGYLRPLVAGKTYGVKIDIEGAELHVLPGMMRAGKPKFIVFEGAWSKRELWDFFTGHDYVIFGLCKDIFRSRVEMLSEFSDWNRFHDFVAVSQAAAIPGGPVPLDRLGRAVRAL